MRVPLYLPTEHELSPTHVCWLRHYVGPSVEVDRLSPDNKVFVVVDGAESGIYYDRSGRRYEVEIKLTRR
jgi:hypothetical protein